MTTPTPRTWVAPTRLHVGRWAWGVFKRDNAAPSRQYCQLITWRASKRSAMRVLARMRRAIRIEGWDQSA